MMKGSFAAGVAAALMSFQAFGGAAFGEEATDQRLGLVHFETSCNETAQRRFDRGMRYQHSFWYQASREIFEDALKADPTCGIAYWGIALSLLFNPHSPTPAPNLPLGLAAIEQGKSAGAKSQRELDYIDALGVFYTDFDKIAHSARVQKYLRAMEDLASKYPNDDEAQILYAIALNVAASPKDKTYVNQLKGIEILEPIFRRQPRHPGVAHYLIHLYDNPVLAEKGLDAARRYASIAPAAPHALHMPSHIFTRVGAWADSINSNLASAQAAKEGKDFDEQLHATDYLVYAYLQRGEDEKAQAAAAGMSKIAGINPDRFTGPYALAASSARCALERGDWKKASELEVPESKYAFAAAMIHFAHALGNARAANPSAARPAIAKLAELRDQLLEAKDAYWAEQVDIQRQAAEAWALYAEGKHEEALTLLRAASDAEDRTEKHPVTPGVPRPARELLGEMLLDRGMVREALQAFEGTLKKEPNRFNALAGAAEASARIGDAERASFYYTSLLANAVDASAARPAISSAKKYLGKT